ncbi:MAG: AAA family ATPase [Breznakibacter sp.]
MSLYKEIITWTSNRPLFIQDAIRRLLVNPILTDSDIDELLLLLKKEIGFTGIAINAIPATNTNIPTNIANSTNITRLLSIENPININALWNNAKLYPKQDGLTLIYGKNGSGKSSYARILKKLCWSRHKNIELKKNVYSKDITKQSVKITFTHEGNSTTLEWKENENTHSALNSVYLFDSYCASIYLNSENVTEYKPMGIDLLENLIRLCHKIDASIDDEIKLLVTTKPQLDFQKYRETNGLNWYNQIENKKKAEIESVINYTEENDRRKKELTTILQNSNPSEANKSLQQKLARFNTVKSSVTLIENFFSDENRIQIEDLKKSFNAKRDAYLIAQEKFKEDDPLAGVGSESWRALWQAAKKYAISEVHPQTPNYPAEKSAEICVLCQQPLSTGAKNRLDRFKAFVIDETSKEFTTAENIFKAKITEIEKIELIPTDTFVELKSEIPQFEQAYNQFQQQLILSKKEFLDYLKSENSDIQIKNNLPQLSSVIESQVQIVNSTIIANNGLIENRTVHEKELLELDVLEVLNKNKVQILKYYDEYLLKNALNQCKAKTNTKSISSKIGEVLESRAIELQHQEFLVHLRALNPKIADKVSIKKTRTTDGKTFQRCGFSNLNEQLPIILSEGEQKIVALANFLSECTIDGAKNTIIFDDPVNSLDQDYRESIARKIVDLSLDRQIIVLTHDLYFLRLLLDVHKERTNDECPIIGLKEYKGFSGIPSDEIPYLAKNVQQRIDTIRGDLAEIKSLSIDQVAQIEPILERARQRMRKLLERSVEEILTNRTIQRFSKNINLKQENLANLVVVEKTDIDFILSLFGKYSITEHDGSTETISIQPNESQIEQDLDTFFLWKEEFNVRAKSFKQANGYR